MVALLFFFLKIWEFFWKFFVLLVYIKPILPTFYIKNVKMKSLIGSTLGSLTLITLLVSRLFFPVFHLAQVAIIYKTIE